MQKINPTFVGAQSPLNSNSDETPDINSFLSMKDDDGDALFFSNLLIDLLKKASSQTRQTMYDILNIVDDAGKRLFIPSRQLLEFAESCNTGKYNNLIKLISAKDKNGNRLFTCQPAIIDLAGFDKKSQKSAIKLASLCDENGSRLFSDDYAIISIACSPIESQKAAVRLSKLKDENGKKLVDDENLIFEISNDLEFYDDFVKLVKIKGKNGESLFKDTQQLYTLLYSTEEARQIAVKLRSFEDENDVDVSDETYDFSSIVFYIADNQNSNPQIFDNFIALCTLTSDDGTKIFNNDLALQIAKNCYDLNINEIKNLYLSNKSFVDDVLGLDVDFNTAFVVFANYLNLKFDMQSLF